MLERSLIKAKVLETLIRWEIKDGKSTSYNIAKKIGCSQDMVQKVIRVFKEEGKVFTSLGGSHVLKELD